MGSLALIPSDLVSDIKYCTDRNPALCVLLTCKSTINRGSGPFFLPDTYQPQEWGTGSRDEDQNWIKPTPLQYFLGFSLKNVLTVLVGCSDLSASEITKSPVPDPTLAHIKI